MAIARHIVFNLVDERLGSLNDVQRSGIANEMISKIQSRTDSGKDKNGNKFTEYNKSYKESSHFKSAGKGNTVDLEFSKEMMNSLQYLPNLSTGNTIAVGYRNGSELNKRAQYVIDGHGRKGDFTQPKRDFMGLTDSERSDVLGLVPQNGGGSGIFLALTAGFLASIF